MEKILKDDFFIDASPSWNGYNHQGKVGLFVVLDMIKREKISEEEMEIWELELEWFEDFSIKKNTEYIAIHQVKTYKSSAPSDFKEAIWILLAKLLEFENVENAYLHTVKDMSFKDKLREKLKEYSIKESDKGVNIPYESKMLVRNSGKYEELFDKFSLYDYSDESNTHKYHCEMDNIEEAIENKLQEMSEEYLTSKHLKRVYYNLLGLIDNNIKARHINIQNKNDITKVSISFHEIYQIIRKNHESISKEYATYKLKNEFEKTAVEYVDVYKENIEEFCTNDETELNRFIKFSEIINKIRDLNDTDFLELCLKIMPDSPLKKDSVDYEVNLSNMLHTTDLKNCFFRILKEIETEIDSFKWVYVSKNKSYLPSMINDEDDGFGNKIVLGKIFNNENPELLREVDTIITKDITIPFIKDERFFKSIPMEDSEEDNRRYNDRITVMKKVGLIKITDARKELDHEEFYS